MLTRQLTLSDAVDVQAVYDSQPRIMLRDKDVNEPAYAGVFRAHLLSGCVAYGAFEGAELRAFCTVWQWPGFPIATLVVCANKPDGAAFNPSRTGLSAAVNAAFDKLVEDGVPTMYFVRSTKKRWKNSTMSKNFGAFGDSFARAVEYIPAGSPSKHEAINAFVLGSGPPKADAVLVSLTRKPLGDF